MAKQTTKTVTKTVKNPSGTTKTKTTTTKDSSQLTGRQRTKMEKIEKKGRIANQAASVAALGEAAAGATSAAISKEKEKTARERERQATYRTAINKWNGILKSTPEAAEGTNPGQEGSMSGTSSTGSFLEGY